MSRLNEFRKNLEEFRTAETTAAALEDISALHLQSIRSGFERNRTFYAGIRALYGTVRTFGEKKQLKIKKERSTLLVALTSNKRFYGGLMREVVSGLGKSLTQIPSADALVIGRAGWQYIEQMNLVSRVRQTLTEDDMPTAEEFESLLSTFEHYERVLVLYPKFINPFRQDVGIEDITQSPERAIPASEAISADTKTQTGDEDEVGYIFEPEVPEILAFFDAQVVRVLFQGVLLEADLARTAARLLRLEESQERAHTLVLRAQARVRKEVYSISESELLETFAGFRKWSRV